MTQFPIQNGSLSQKEINSEFYFVDIVFLLAGYKVIPGLFSSFLLRVLADSNIWATTVK